MILCESAQLIHCITLYLKCQNIEYNCLLCVLSMHHHYLLLLSLSCNMWQVSLSDIQLCPVLQLKYFPVYILGFVW